MSRLVTLCLAVAPVAAHAFCGFYVAGGGAELFNNATQVVLMREGTRTVLSMENNYQGPPEDFAMVVPVPVVLKKEQVKTLPRDVFRRVDTLSAPRLVEYWEVDPCYVEPRYERFAEVQKSGVMLSEEAPSPKGALVKVEARFEVGEYDIVILSAKDALALEQWLKQNKYKIPAGAEPLFRPYIQNGLKFFVAKVNAKKVKFEAGMAKLSPLRFHYDSEKFELPVRLGLINAKDKQDLIVHVLARNQRYEVANLPNVTIPTNIDLAPSAKSEFPFFYVSLFDRTLAKNPKAVVTEYAWQATSCDPCPSSPLSPADFATLGADVLPTKQGPDDQWNPERQFVLTRLHARYDKTSLGEDLVFRAAKPIVGGREFLTDGNALEQGSRPDSLNNFQGRYAIRYPWKGEVKCKAPVYGRWGGPWPTEKADGQTKTAGDTAFVTRDPTKVDALAESPIAELSVKGVKARAGEALRPAPSPKKK
ncbi:MAG: DUF2330 domain-containing protein [Myxococcaceae bacterium]|jgi:hypothetical protein|nr:DUF2330 domain-containing protein [Myxococcaceae bacterium]